MRRSTFVIRGARFHGRHHMAMMWGVMVGTATLTGALLMGDSMRASLREAVVGRLGRVTHAMVVPRFVRERLASDIASAVGVSPVVERIAPAILLRGGATHAQSKARVERVSVLGVSESFWKLDVEPVEVVVKGFTGRSVILNEPLARELHAATGDDVLVRIGKPSAVSTETLLGRRDDTTLTLRLTVRAVIPARGLGAFSLNPRQGLSKNAYVPLATLQRAIDRRGRINALLVATGDETQAAFVHDSLQKTLGQTVTMEDFGVVVRVDAGRGYLALESDAVLIDPIMESAATTVATTIGLTSTPILTYLANTIEVVSDSTGSDRSSSSPTVIPYSTMTALDIQPGGAAPLTLTDGRTAPALQAGEILLNAWAAKDLHAAVGDRVRVSYYVTSAFGRLDTKQTAFTLRGVVRMDEAGTDTGYTPSYKGITDTKSIADWDPPFPIDLSKVRDKDEKYWDRFRATPKAFISLAEGRRLWAKQGESLGRVTSIRFAVQPDGDLTDTARAFQTALRKHLDVARFGIRFDSLRARLVQASGGSTDFGMLFIGFSFFLIASAAMLVSLLFRLGVERRAAEVGTLLATGFTPGAVARLFIAEGAVPAVVGAAAGLLVAKGYAWLMLAGLRSWWTDAVHTPFLQLHTPATTLLIGFVASFVIALASIAWAVRSLVRLSPCALLAGVVAKPKFGSAKRGWWRIVAIVTAVTAGVLILLPLAVPDALPPSLAFFGSGASLLVAGLALFRNCLTQEWRSHVPDTGVAALARWGARNVLRNPGRSLLTAGLIASGTFIVASLQAFRLEPVKDVSSKNTGTGGFSLVAESAVPLPYDLNTPEGRESLGITPQTAAKLAHVKVTPFRLRPGDESSCLNLYRPTRPRILGASRTMIDRGGFTFSATLADSQQGKKNPWLLLRRKLSDGAVPVIGDEAAVLWQLHCGLGKDLVITDERGEQVSLRFVALLSGSVLQDELIVAQDRFKELFPSITGHAFFLIETPPQTAVAVAQTLEDELSAFSWDATSTNHRLAEYQSVQNTYLATFQTLGGLGLVLGTLGLAVVLLRNVEERRGELALMRALGFRRVSLGSMVLAENALLVLMGLLAGTLPALLAIIPAILHRPQSIPWLSMGLTVVGVFVAGVVVGLVVLRPTLRAPLLRALRTE